MATEKRARKKQHRDQRRAAYEAALRRRRMIRLISVLVVLAIIVSLGLSFGDGGEEPAADRDRQASPSPSIPQSDEVACGAEAPKPAKPKQYDEPKQVLEPDVDYAAVIQTSCGKIELDLLEEDAAETVNSFVFLAEEGYFDGLAWHRIVGNFVIQSGDPDGVNGQEPDGPGYTIKDELPKKAKVYTFGTVAMANSGANTGGSQFFIVTHQGPDGETDVPAGLTPDYAVFGLVDEGSFDVVEELGKLPTVGGNDPSLADVPRLPVYIESIRIVEA